MLRPKSMMRRYQTYVARQIVKSYGRRPGVLLALEMALGKTVSALTAIRQLLDEGCVRKVLIVAPLRVAENTWPDEIEEWEHLKALRYAVMTGTAEQRLAALQKDVEIYIINRENLPWLLSTLNGVHHWPFDMLVYDESSRLKAGRERTDLGVLSEFGVLAKTRKKMPLAILLTGTPTPNGLIDLWGQAYIIDFGQRLGAKITHFRNRWFTKNEYSMKWEPKPFAKAQIIDRMRDVMLAMKAEDFVELPEELPNYIYVDLPPKAKKEYDRFERSMISQLYDVEAVNRGVLTNKLLQFANGSMYREDENGEREVVAIHDAKLKALREITSDPNCGNLLVAYNFQFDLAAIRRAYNYAVVFDEEPNAVRLWNEGKIRMLLAHPASIGHGLNLQHGGDTAVWYGLTWSLELYEQFNRRLRRPGQKSDRVVLHHILARKTADEAVVAALRRKGQEQQDIVNAVRLRLEDLK